VKVAAKMRVARGALSRRDLRDRVVAAVRVDDEVALRTAEDAARSLAASVTGEDERDVGVTAVVRADEGPDEAVLRLPEAVVLHPHPSLVGLHHRARSDPFEDPRRDRPHDFTRSVQKLVHRRACEREAEPPEVLLEAVDR